MKFKQFSPMKLLHHLDYAKAIAQGKNVYPLSYEIDPSNLCNHGCIWCMYEDFMLEKKEMIRKEKLRSIVDEILGLGAQSITFTGGGDPLTHPETVELIPRIKHTGTSVAIITNGGLLDREKCWIMVENLSYIRISVDAASRATHEKLHCPKNQKNDNYDLILDNIAFLVEEKKRRKKVLQIGVGYLVHPDNVSEIYAFVENMKKIGVDYVQIRPVCNLQPDQRRIINTQSREQIEASVKLTDPDFNIFPMLTRFDEILWSERSYDVCYGHALVGIIAADSGVYLCCQLKGNPHALLGDLNENTFKEIWSSHQRKGVVENLDPNKCPPCRYNKYNEMLEYMAENDHVHAEFL